MTNKQVIAGILETAAFRSKYPATEKQCSFLASLISKDEFNRISTSSSESLSKKEASQMIDAYLKNPVSYNDKAISEI